MFTKKFIIIMAIIIGALIIFIAGLLIWKNFSEKTPKDLSGVNSDNAPLSSIEAGKKATGNLIEETKKLASGDDVGKIAQVISVSRTDKNGSTTEESAVVIAPLSNPISVDSGEVLTRDGTAKAKENTRAGDRDAVLQSSGVDSSKLPASTVKLSISPLAIVPAQFTVSPGQAVSLAVTASNMIEVFRFEDSALASVAAGIKAGETVVLIFNAPTKLGEYVYFSDYLDHRAQGAVGKMIVQ